jgi:tetratricopeptide (TPR) repeat protein
MASAETYIFWNPAVPAERKTLARYVLEGLDDIAQIFHQAKVDLRKLTGDPSFCGYVSGDPRRVRLEVKALYQRLQKGKPKAGGDCLSYVLEPNESVGGRQRIRLAREVLFWGHGVCLDWVLLFAACLAHARIYSLIIITEDSDTQEDHAILGYWVDENRAKSSNRIVLDRRIILPLLKDKQIMVINATRIPLDEHGRSMKFEEAEKEAETWIDSVLYGVDIRLSREAGIEPLLPTPIERIEDDIVPQSKEFLLHESFTERPHLSACVDDFINDSKRKSGYLLFIGGAGEGKSAFVARCVKKKLDDPTSYEPVFHFIRRTEPGWDNPERMLRSLTAQLHRKHGVPLNEGLRARLQMAQSDQERVQVAADLFADTLERVSRVLATEVEKEVLWMDGLDEAFGPTGSYHNTPGLPGLLPAQLPPGIYAVLTSRPGDHLQWLSDLNLCVRYRLEDDRQISIDQVREYFTQHSNDVAPPLDAHFIGLAAERAQGNFYIAVQKLAEIRRNPTVSRDPDAIPASVKEYHAKVYSQVVAQAQRTGFTEQQVRFVLGLLAEVREPLTPEQLEAFAVPDYTMQILTWSADYFRPRPPQRSTRLPFEFNHTSIPEFLSEQLTHRERQAVHAHVASACLNWRELEGDARLYAMRHLPTHLAEAHRWDDLLGVVMDSELDYLTKWVEKGEGEQALRCLEGLIEHLERKDTSLDTAAGLATQLARIHSLRGRYDKSRHWLEYALGHASSPSGGRIKAVALHELGSLHKYRGEVQQAIRCYQEALKFCLEGEEVHHDEAAANLIGLATVSNERYQFLEAIRSAKEALEHAKLVNDMRHEAAAQRLIGTAFKHLGRYDEADAALRSALQVCEASDAELEKARVLNVMAYLQYDMALLRHQLPTHARTYFTDAMEASKHVSDLYCLLDAKVGLGGCALAMGATAEATSWFHQIRDALPQGQHSELLVAVRLGLAGVLHQNGMLEEAAQRYQETIAFCEQIDVRRGLTRAWVGLGAAQWHLGMHEQAQACWNQALQAAERISSASRHLTQVSIDSCKADCRVTPR